MLLSNRWVSFDCFGTLVDWQTWFTEVLGPLGGAAAADVIRAYHAHERVVERDYPHRSYKDVLAIALSRAMAERGASLSPRTSQGVTSPTTVARLIAPSSAPPDYCRKITVRSIESKSWAHQ